jgi:hypothetical protein
MSRIAAMTTPTASIVPLVPDEDQREARRSAFFMMRGQRAHRLGTLKRTVTKRGSGGDEAAEEGANDADFDDSVVMGRCLALQQSWEEGEQRAALW